MSAPAVYRAIAAITAMLSRQGIEKNRTNEDSNYRFRGIDDIYNALSPQLAEHKLCILPRVLDRQAGERRTQQGVHTAVCLRVAFDFVSAEDGSSHAVEAYGEAWDHSDKATSKAMSAAFKAAILQAFCVPIDGRDDPDGSTPGLPPSNLPSLPRDWSAWTDDFILIVRSCHSDEALDRLQSSNRHLLRSLALDQRSLYDRIGDEIKDRRGAIKVLVVQAGKPGAQAPKVRRRRAKPVNPAVTMAEVAHAAA